MTYINPLRFIEPSLQSLDEFQPSMLKKAKQRVLAEFELSEDGIIEIDGQTVEKMEVLAAIESLNDERKRGLYWAILKVPSLEAFLANPTVVQMNKLDWPKLANNKEALAMIKDQLEEIFQQLMQKSIATRNQLELRIVLIKCRQMPGIDFQAVRQPLLSALAAMMEEMGNAHQQYRNQMGLSTGLLSDLSGNFWPNALNALGKEFRPLRIEFVQVLAQIIKDCHLQPNTLGIGKKILERALQVQTDENTRTSLEQFVYAGSTSGPSANSGPKGKSKGGTTIAVILGICLIAIRLIMAGYNSNRSHSSSYSSYGSSSSSSGYVNKADEDWLNNIMPEAERKEANKKDDYRKLVRTLLSHAKQEDKQGKWPKSIRPKTGTETYTTYWAAPGKDFGQHRLHFKNASKKDVVLLLENDKQKLESAHYVRAGDSWEFARNNGNAFTALIYNGSKWQDSIGVATTYSDGKVKVPGFQEQVDFIARYKKVDLEVPAYLASYQDAIMADLHLKFDGKKITQKHVEPK